MKNMLLTYMNTSTAVSAGGTVPLGSAVHGIGRGIRLNGNNILYTDCGLTKFIATVSMTVTGTDPVTLSILEDGVVVASTTAKAQASGAAVSMTLPWVIRKKCEEKNISMTVSAGGNITNVVTLSE